MKHLILGAGPAGVIAAETLRKHATNDRIVVIGDEPEAPYSRMAIPYLLAGNIGEDGTHLRHSANHFAGLNIEVRHGRAASVDTAAKVVPLEGGASENYDRLLIATGSSPASPPIPGIHSEGVHTCWTLADARAITKLATQGARVLQMGAGFIGCIILEALAARGVQLTVVEMGDRMVPRMMGPTAGAMIKEWCQAKGLHVLTGTRVTAIEPGAPLKVSLSNGDLMECDLVISATGVKPNIGFLQGSGIGCEIGVLTSERMQSNVAEVFAAGDCAQALDLPSGKLLVSAIQPNAADQARVAALNMLGQRATLPQVTQINVLDTLGLISASFGEWEGVPGGEQAELTDRAAGKHLSLQFGNDTLVGINSVGWTEHVGVMRGLVEGQVSLGDWKPRLMRDPTLLMETYLARAQAQQARALVKS
jgi:NADPH-dependent 2,4-dienoyl-CoA reductase/sulfur reductase-like enzyme